MILKQWSEILRNVTMLSQLGLSFITPLLLCLALCWFIISKTGVGVWSTFRDFSSEWVVRQPWHTSFICRSINSKRKNIKKTKYILTDIHKHLHEGQNNGKEVTVLEDMRDHTEQLRKEWNYEQYIG